MNVYKVVFNTHLLMFVSDITSQNINALQCTRQYFGDPVSNAEHPTPLGLHREGE